MLATSTGTEAPPASLSTGVRRGLALGSEIPVTLIPGDGIGKEIADSVVGVFGGTTLHLSPHLSLSLCSSLLPTTTSSSCLSA
jgi:hypothetical protein